MKKSGNRARRQRRKQWILRRDRRNFLNPRIAFYRQKSDLALWGLIDDHTRNSVSGKQNEPIEIRLPAQLDFEENYETTASHLQIVRSAAYGRFRIKNLHFDNLEFISPAAALVLASEVDRWNQRVGGRLRANVDSWKEDIKRLLCQMGYFELLGLERPDMPAKDDSVTFLKFLSGDSSESDSGKLAKQLRINIEAIVGKGIKKHTLFEGLSEAITNVSQHAYPPTISSGQKKQWWLSASFDKRTNGLYVMFYDQGVGIPKTLPKSRFFERMKSLFGTWTDSQKIEAAMAYGRSSIPRPERGKGLNNLVEFASAHEEGRLSIYSQNGLYRIVHTRDDKIEMFRRDHEKTVGGTLIEWSVKL